MVLTPIHGNTETWLQQLLVGKLEKSSVSFSFVTPHSLHIVEEKTEKIKISLNELNIHNS